MKVEFTLRYGFGGPETRAIEAARDIDRIYLHDRITAPEAQRAGLAYIKRVYLSEGSPLYEYRDAGAVEGFRQVLGDQGTALPAEELGLVIDTAVQRLRAWGAVLQMDESGAGWCDVWAVLRDGTSPICRAMHAKQVSVRVAADEVRYHKSLTPEGMRRHLEETQPRLETMALEGDLPGMARLRRILPPYHLGCRTRVKLALDR